MQLTIEFSIEEIAALEAKAAAEGLTLPNWLHKLACQKLNGSESQEPFLSGYGMLAGYGPAPSEEEIDESRREMLRGFAEDF
jgi:hypothetical protein